MPFGTARYGANIIGFTNADPCVITVDSTQFFNIGDSIRVANVVCDLTGNQLNGDYLITLLTNNTITIDQDTSLFGIYISGGFVTVLEESNPNPTPFLQANILQEFIPWKVFNQAIGGGTIPTC
jgi:hypothetical protein